jgi:hypothetical protein
VKVEERGKIVVKRIEDTLPPAKWMKQMRREVQPDAKDPDAVIASIWWQLSPKKKLEIMRRTRKFKGYA